MTNASLTPYAGVGSYSGLMEEMYLYTQALTERYVNLTDYIVMSVKKL